MLASWLYELEGKFERDNLLLGVVEMLFMFTPIKKEL